MTGFRWNPQQASPGITRIGIFGIRTQSFARFLARLFHAGVNFFIQLAGFDFGFVESLFGLAFGLFGITAGLFVLSSSAGGEASGQDEGGSKFHRR